MLTTTPTVLDERAWQELVDALTRRQFGIGAGDGSSGNNSVVLQFE